MLLVLHLAATFFMTGVIWFVQIVHYPLMAMVGTEQFAVYSRSHQRRTSMVVLPVMLIELGTGIWLALTIGGSGVSAWLAWGGLILLLVIWMMTFCVHVPQHGRLLRGFDPIVHARLVATNGIRTAAWTLRSLFVIGLLLTVKSA